MTALESFNALDNREVSRKEVEQVLAQAKAENNTAIIYRLSRVLNDSPEATHFEITITHYDSSVGLSGVQHTGDYREALDDCGRLRKGWKFVKGNVVKVEEKPKKEAKPKKEKTPQKEETKSKKESKPKKETDKTAIDEIIKIVQERLKNQGKPRLYEVLHLESVKGIFIFSWSDLGNIDGTKKKENALAKGLYQYTFPKFKTTQEKIEFSNQVWYDLLINKSLTLKRVIKEPTLNIINYYLGKNTIEDIESTSKKITEEAKPKKEKTPQKETKKDKKYKFVVITDDLPSRVIAVFSYTNPNIEELRERFWKNSEGKYYETTEEGLRNYNFGIGFYPFEKAKKHIEKKYTEGKDFIYFRIEKDGDRDEAISLVEKPKKEAKPKKEKTPQKETKKAPKSIKFSDIDNNRTLIESFTDKNTGTSRLFVKDSLGLTFSFYPMEKFMAVEQISALYGKDRKEEAEKDYSRMKEEIAWAFNHHVRTAQRKGTLEVCEKYFLENLPELLAKGGLWLEAKAKNKGAAAAKSSLTKLRSQVWDDIGALAEGVSTENVQDSSKKKVEKAPNKATKSLKSKEGNVQNVANFTLLQEPTKVFLEFEDKKNQAYYKNSADKQGAVGADFLKKVIKDLKKQNLREEPRGFINTEDFPISPTISKVTGIDSLKTVVVKDKNRPTLECVLIEADRYVATDLYNIILLNRSKNDGLKTGALYDPNYKCTKIGGCSKEDYYRILDYGFPNYKHILTENPVYTSDWVAIEPIIQHLKSGLEVIRKIYDWKKVYVVKITSNVGEGHYNLKHLLNDLQILQSNGAKKIRLYTNKLDEKLNIETDNGNIVVTMAVYIGDRSNYDVISPLRIAPIQLHFTQNRKEEKGLSGVDYSQGLFGAVPEVSTERFKTLKEAKRFFLKWALEHLRGKKIYHKELKKYVVFNRTGIEHSLSSKISYDKLKLITQAEKMLKESHLIGFEEEYKGRENIAGVYRMKATAILDEEKVGVILTLREGENGVIYYDHKIEEIERNAVPPREGRAQSFCGDSVSSKATSIPAPSVTERLRDSSLSEGKGTKKSLTCKKKDENFGLNASEAPVTSLPAPRQTLAQQLATRPEVRESFLVADEQMSLFLGALEKKTKDSLVITLTGKQGSGKTRFAFQFMNALAQRYRVGHASIEEHPESVLYEEKAYQYLNDTALEHITAQDVRSLEELDTMIRTNEVIVIDSFQKMRELAPHFEIDKDLRKKYDGKLFLVIFQQTADGKMRGGSKSQFDGDIILFTETFPDYRENYVYPDKNRYNKRPATELQYSIYEQRMLATAPEVPALPAHYEPTESEELNFEVL